MIDSMIPTERAAIVTARLLAGRAMTVREVAEAVELTHSGAAKLLARISRVLPVYDEDGVWRINSGEPDPFEHDDPAKIRAALARMDQRMMEEQQRIADCR